jgi:ribosome-associated protein
MSAVRDVSIEGDMMRLGQFLKWANVIDTGGTAKIRIEDGEVSVNGEVETRRGRQLHVGDVVQIDNERLRVTP